MSVWGRVAVAGVYEHPTRFAPDKTAYQIHAESARGALADAICVMVAANKDVRRFGRQDEVFDPPGRQRSPSRH